MTNEKVLCACCGKYCTDCDIYITYDGYVCEDCYCNHYFECEDCGGIFHNDKRHSIGSYYRCDSCAKKYDVVNDWASHYIDENKRCSCWEMAHNRGLDNEWDEVFDYGGEKMCAMTSKDFAIAFTNFVLEYF